MGTAARLARQNKRKPYRQRERNLVVRSLITGEIISGDERPKTFKEQYYEYLRSPEWDRLRKRVFKRDRYQCTKCGSRRKLQAHHLTYKRVFHEWLSDLITVCRKCHKKIHKINPRVL